MKASKLDMIMGVWQEARLCMPIITSMGFPLTTLGHLEEEELAALLPLMIIIGDYLNGLER